MQIRRHGISLKDIRSILTVSKFPRKVHGVANIKLYENKHSFSVIDILSLNINLSTRKSSKSTVFNKILILCISFLNTLKLLSNMMKIKNQFFSVKGFFLKEEGSLFVSPIIELYLVAIYILSK